uniref:Venom peptide HtAMP2 n=1 Tax=Hadogenes troglodytes TaxID=1577150 RepID=A0A1B3IJ55_9SCOR|nr:venom peptide HtAMP2 [Hadogenes troglodytes]
MRTQLAVLLVALVLLRMIAQSEALWGEIWNTVKGLIGKRGLRNLDDLDDVFDDDLSAADLEFLKQLMR